MSNALRRPSTALLVPLICATGMAACGHQAILHQYQEMRPAMARGDWDTASAQLDKAKDKVYGQRDRVMYWLNKGLVLHYAHKAQESNEILVKAEAAMDELWTTSISQEAS